MDLAEFLIIILHRIIRGILIEGILGFTPRVWTIAHMDTHGFYKLGLLEFGPLDLGFSMHGLCALKGARLSRVDTNLVQIVTSALGLWSLIYVLLAPLLVAREK